MGSQGPKAKHQNTDTPTPTTHSKLTGIPHPSTQAVKCWPILALSKNKEEPFPRYSWLVVAFKV